MFHEWCRRHSVSEDWTLHAAFIHWLARHSPERRWIRHEHHVEALAAAASRWARTDFSEKRGVAIYSPELGSRLVVAWKRRAAAAERTIFLLPVERAPLRKAASFFLLATFGEIPGGRGWQALGGTS